MKVETGFAWLLMGLVLAAAGCGSDDSSQPNPDSTVPAAGTGSTTPATAGTSTGTAGTGAAGTATTPPASGSGGKGVSSAAGTMSTPAPSAGSSSGAGGSQPAAAGTAGGAGASAAGSGGAAGMSTPDNQMPPADGGAPMPSEGCMSGMLKAGRSMGSIQSSGGNRTFIQYVPSSYDGKKPVPLLVDLHPFSVGASFAESSSGFRQLADMEGYVYLAPQGMGNMWDSVGDVDSKFIRDLVADTAKKGCIDLRRVYATGCSNGGAFSFLLMCTASDVFAAVAPMCGTSFVNLQTNCMQQRPVSLMLRIGRQDTANCWEGESKPLNAPNVPAGTKVDCAKTVQKTMTEKYHCKGQIMMEGRCEIVGDCDQGTQVAICGEATGHVVYSPTIARDTWAFLEKFYKP
ncbi:MAG TPA: hypothetical protein VJR89_24790 [Polyangiales bacterium]|nr:hypothetical protein [Polyangiales bacterium]